MAITLRSHAAELERLNDKILVDTIRPQLRAAIDRLLARGLTDRMVLDLVADQIREAGVLFGNEKAGLVLAQVGAYLDSVQHGGAPCPETPPRNGA